MSGESGRTRGELSDGSSRNSGGRDQPRWTESGPNAAARPASSSGSLGAAGWCERVRSGSRVMGRLRCEFTQCHTRKSIRSWRAPERVSPGSHDRLISRKKNQKNGPRIPVPLDRVMEGGSRQNRASDDRGLESRCARVDFLNAIFRTWRILNWRWNYGHSAIGLTAILAVKIAKIANFCATPPLGD